MVMAIGFSSVEIVGDFDKNNFSGMMEYLSLNWIGSKENGKSHDIQQVLNTSEVMKYTLLLIKEIRDVGLRESLLKMDKL